MHSLGVWRGPADILDAMLRPTLPSRALATARTAGATLRLAAGLLLLALVLALSTASPASSAATTPREPLAVSIDSLDAATINGTGPIQISGTVTNLDDTAWKDVHVYPFLGDAPVTSEADLAAQVALPENALVGSRIIAEGHYATIPEVAPGETVAWSFSIPRSLLRQHVAGAGGPGVYWFGVHALGPSAAGETPTADGRARTFLPLIPKRRATAEPEKVAVVLPIRRRVIHQPDGRISNVAGWARQLGDQGRLGRLVSFGSESTEVSYLLDPAVLDAVHQLAEGNPPRNLGPSSADEGTGSPSGSSSPSESSGSPGSTISPGTSGADGTDDADDPSQSSSGASSVAEDAETKAAAQAASRWLDRLKASLPGREVLVLPYADPDLAALAVHAPKLYAAARDRANAVMDELGIHGEPVVAPPDGYLDQKALGLLQDHPTTLVSDAMLRGRTPTLARLDGHRLVVTSAAAASGGPAPGDPWSPVAMRQRIVAQAALRLAHHRPLVVVLPDSWSPPGATREFFDTLLAEPWLDLTTVSDAVSGQSVQDVSADRLVYPRSEAKAQIGSEVFRPVDELIAAGQTLQNVLTHNSGVADDVLAEALSSTSYAARRGHGKAAERSLRVIDGALDDISVETPTGVTLSGASGRFAVTVANGLDEPVTVRLHAHSDHDVSISGPDSVQVGPNARSTVTLNARAAGNGVHTVRLGLTDSHGTHIGTGAVLPIRSAQVSTIIWWFVGVGCALLFLAIAVRLVRRIQRRTTTEES